MAAETLAAIIRECDELFMCPTMEMQLAACEYAERAAAELAHLKAADQRFPWEPVSYHALSGSELRSALMTQRIKSENKQRAAARQQAEQERLLAQQRENEQEWTTGVAWDDPRLNEMTSSVRMDVTCAEAIVNGHSTYLAQIPQHQREVVVPALGRSKRSAVSEYSTAGQHQKVGWNFYTDLFECHECDQGAQLKMDLMKLPCTRKKGRR